MSLPWDASDAGGGVSAGPRLGAGGAAVAAGWRDGAAFGAGDPLPPARDQVHRQGGQREGHQPEQDLSLGGRQFHGRARYLSRRSGRSQNGPVGAGADPDSGPSPFSAGLGRRRLRRAGRPAVAVSAAVAAPGRPAGAAQRRLPGPPGRRGLARRRWPGRGLRGRAPMRGADRGGAGAAAAGDDAGGGGADRGRGGAERAAAGWRQAGRWATLPRLMSRSRMSRSRMTRSRRPARPPTGMAG